ncbi:MAG: GIY-YIG nuclease family protein [Ignisphaera sp.]|nr:GIY-YIG nuclease family protein [Ignisphaera sp.]MDW8084850.1 GIY-YIG nuclease family protein [Ignisphaera sp.]
MIAPVSGVYVLIFKVARDTAVRVGSLGTVQFPQGVYGYIGSARGAGGVRARILHHTRKVKRRLWWHIDYLTVLPYVTPLYVVYSGTSRDAESILAHQIGLSPCWSAHAEGFGSSDKSSSTHLYLCRCSEDVCLYSIAEAFRAIGFEPLIEKIDGAT